VRVWSLVEGRWRKGENPSAEAWWFHVVGESDGLNRLAKRFGLHPLAIEDCYSKNLHVPKIDDFGEHIFVVLQIVALAAVDHIDRLEELDIFLGPNFLITYSDREIPEVEAVHGVLSESISVRPGSDGLFHAIADRAIDAILPKLNAIGDELDALQEQILQQPDAEVNRAVLEIRGRAGRLRRVLTPQMNVMLRLSRGEFGMIRDPNRIYFRDVYDHLMRDDLALESLREDAEVALSTYLAVISNRLNEVMKVLSVVGALALPAVVVAGIFGTNFDNLPWRHTSWGFVGMIGFMVAMAGAMGLYFRRRGWF
jgi:magnesium transporter